MDSKRNRPYHDYEQSFWPLPGIMMLMVIVVRARVYKYICLRCTPETIFIISVVHARNYNYNHCRHSKC